MSYMKNGLADVVYNALVIREQNMSDMATSAVRGDPRCITVEIREVYGADVVYPVSRGAFVFAQLAGTKTLTRRTVELIKQLGYTIDVKPRPEVTL